MLVAVGDTALSETPVRHQPVTVERLRWGQHSSAVIGRTGRWPGPVYASTGLEFLDPFGADGLGPYGADGLGPYGVGDGRGLQLALDQARTGRELVVVPEAS